MNVRRLVIVALVLAIIFGLLVYLHTDSTAPPGQHALVRLDAANFSQLRDAFNAARGSVRVIAMFSPT